MNHRPLALKESLVIAAVRYFIILRQEDTFLPLYEAVLILNRKLVVRIMFTGPNLGDSEMDSTRMTAF